MGPFSTRWPSHRIPVFALAIATFVSASAYNAQASPPEEVGPEFQEFHSQSGGLPTLGHPLSPRVLEHERVVQYFERQRVEHHPENQYPYTVLLGRLGAEEAEARGLLWSHAFERRGPDAAHGDSCRYFEPTGHHVCAGFRQYWESNGLSLGDAGISERESIALFGYPISAEFTDPDSGLTVQYFERAVFEYHDQHAGTENHVLLGRLAAPLWNQRASTATLAPEPVAQPVEHVAPQAPDSVGQQIADLARQFVGYPYVWGATGPNSFDCSGFTYYVLNQVVGGYARDMFGQAGTGAPVSREDLQPGDVVFHQNTYRPGLSHAGIYVGGGKFVNAANPGAGVIVSDLWDSYWGSRFHSARRVR